MRYNFFPYRLGTSGASLDRNLKNPEKMLFSTYIPNFIKISAILFYAHTNLRRPWRAPEAEIREILKHVSKKIASLSYIPNFIKIEVAVLEIVWTKKDTKKDLQISLIVGTCFFWFSIQKSKIQSPISRERNVEID